MSSLDLFSSTIEKLYSAASDPTRWEEALHSVENFTGSAGAVIDLVPKGNLPPITLSGRFTAEQCTTYANQYQHLCRRVAFGVAHPHIPIQYDYMVLTEQEMDRDPVYAWLGESNLRYYILGHLGETPEYTALAGLQRWRAQGHAQSEDFERFALIRPHMAQAITLAGRLASLSSELQLEWGLLEALPQAVFALDETGRVLLANSQADDLLAANEGLALTEQLLRTTLAKDQVALDTLIRRASDPVGNGPAGWCRLGRLAGKPPLAVFVSHLADPERRLGCQGARVLVIVVDPMRALEPNLGALKQVFGLSPMEASVACALGARHDLASAANVLGIAFDTARAHLRAIFRKLGISRQQDLIAILSWLQWGQSSL